MKLALRVGLLVGLAVMIALILRADGAAILAALSRMGLVLLWLVPLRGLSLLLDVMGWRVLIPGRPALGSVFVVAAIREGINRLLPVANVGGEIVAIRLLSQRGIESTLAAASMTVELLLTLISQYLFVAIGVLCLLRLTGAVSVVGNVALGLAVSLPVIAAFVVLLHRGAVFARIERSARRLFRQSESAQMLTTKAEQLDAAIRALLMTWTRLASVIGWQLSGLVAGSLESWLILRWLGHPLSFGGALALESLTQAARSIFFLIPAGLGVQEMGLIGFGSLLGLDGGTAIALSLAKRVREILFCLPALAVWQMIEAKGLVRGWSESD